LREIRWDGYVAVRFGRKNIRETRPLERSRLNGKILLKLIFKRNDGNVDRMNMLQGSDKWPLL
jgi:hypothetical protein